MAKNSEEPKLKAAKTVRVGGRKFITVSCDRSYTFPFSITGLDQSGDEFFLWLTEAQMDELIGAVRSVRDTSSEEGKRIHRAYWANKMITSPPSAEAANIHRASCGTCNEQ